MWSRVIIVLCASVCAAIPVGANAQERQWFGSIGGGFTAPNAEVRDHLGDGYNFNLGVQFDATPMIAVEGVYSFNGLGEKNIAVNVFPQPLAEGGTPTDFFADMSMQYFTGSVILQRPNGGIRPYGVAGIGVYYRPIRLTTPGVGWVPGYCDPWYYICYPGGWVETTNIVGERSSTDFGMTFGGGVNFGIVFAEVRYHYIWGPTVRELQSAEIIDGALVAPERTADGQFLATTFGIRF
jgi:opacity protein-like surface antigen